MPVSEAQTTVEDNIFKLDYGFYEKIEQMQSNFTNAAGQRSDSANTIGPRSDSVSEQHTLPTHSIIIVTNDGDEQSLETTLRGLNATNIFVDTTLNYIIAEIPIDQIVPLVVEEDVVKIGDGQEPLTELGFTTAQKASIGASNIPSEPYNYTGKGVTVAVIDSDNVYFDHVDLMGKNVSSVSCAVGDDDGDGCVSGGAVITNHATSMAGIVAANNTSDPAKKGIAPDSRIYSIKSDTPTELNSGYLAYAVSHTVTKGIKIATVSIGTELTCVDYTALAIIIDRAVKEGLSYSTAVGNHNDGTVGTVGQQACGFNLISVGAVDANHDRYLQSSLGPATFTTPSGDTGRIKPEITALGVDVEAPTRLYQSSNTHVLPTLNRNDLYETDSGTSHANAVVAGASALILEKQKNYTPLEIKAALLIGADWNAPVPATASDYDNDVRNIRDEMNEYGFGILNIERSLDYANNDDFPNIIYEISPPIEDFANKRYMITVQQDEQVKVLLSWLIHPRDSIIYPTLPINHRSIPFSSQFHNYDVTVSRSDGTVIGTSNSDIQNNEFVVFDATPGNYVITVSSDGVLRTDTNEPFVIASTHPLDAYPFETTVTTTGITFTPTLSDDRSRITLQFSERLSKEFVPGDFTISDGTITSIENFQNSAYRYLEMSGVPYDTDITVRYTGTTYNLGTGTNELATDTESVATGIPGPIIFGPTVTFFADDFQGILSSWTLGGDDNWEIAVPHIPVLGQQSGNEVLTSNDCSRQCIISMDSKLDTSSSLTVEFDLFVDRSIDDDEGLFVEYSIDDVSWITLASYTGANSQNTNQWAETALTLDIPQSSASLRFLAKSTVSSEIVELDNISIFPTPAALVTSFTDDFQRIPFSWTLSGDNDWEATTPHRPLPGQQSDNRVLSSNDCDVQCIISMKSKLDTPSSITIEFDRFVDHNMDGDEGLYVQYSTDDIDWTTLASYTEDNSQDTNRWEDTTLTANISQNSTSLRLLAKVNTSTEFVEIDNISISLTPLTDTVAPAITVPSDKTFEATGALTSLTATQIGTATATDGEDPNPTVTNNATSSFPVGTTTITWTATDSSDNSVTAIQRITIRDTTPPVITTPADASFTTPGTSVILTASDYGTATAIDLVDISPEITSDAPSSFPVGNTTITWTATDDYQNSANATQTVTVVAVTVPDTEPPTITPSGDKTFEATGLNTTISIEEIVAPHISDEVDPNPILSNNITGPFTIGTTVIVWTATDSSNNTSTAIQTITIQDTTAPTITVPPNVSFNTTGAPLSLTQADYGIATAIDLVDISPEITSDAPSSFPVGNTTITWTATDDYQNSANATQTVTVTTGTTIDTTPPGVSSITRSDPTDSVTDRQTLVFNVAFSEPVTDTSVENFVLSPGSPTAGSTYTHTPALAIPDGQTVQDVMAVSGQGTVSTISASVNITHTWIGDLKVELVSPNGTASVLHDNTGGSDNDITETYAPNFVGVSISGNWTLRINDTTSPDPGVLNSWTLTFGSNPITNVSGTGDSRLVTVLASRSGTYNLNVVPGGISDLAGNLLSNTVTTGADESYIVNMTSSDVTPPTITAPVDVTVEATGPLTPVSLITIIVEDGVDPNPIISNNATDSFPLGNTTVTWTATDSSGNASTVTQLITIRDTTSPSFVPAPANVSMTFATGVTTAVSFDIPVATDLVDTAVDVSCTPQSGSIFSAGDTTASCTATDDSNNSITASFTVSVTIEDAPLFPPEVLEAKATDSEVILTWYPPTVGSAIGYQVLRGTDSGLSVLVNNTQSTDTVFVDYLASSSTSYTYQIRAVTADGLSPLSNSVNVTTSPTGILDLRATSTNSTVTLTWNAVNSEALTRYIVDKAYGIDGIAGASIWFLDSNDLMLNDTNVSVGDTFVYHIFADDGRDYSDYLYYDFIVVTVGQAGSVPVVTPPPDVTAEATGHLTVVSIGNATATDDTDANPTITNNSTGSFPLGSTVVAWTATDSSDNTSTAYQTVTVHDTTPPEFGVVPDVRAATASQGFNATFAAPAASDLVDGTVVSSCTPESGTRFVAGNTTVSCTATDDSKNQAATTFTVSVERNQNAIETYGALFYDHFEIDGLSKWNATEAWRVGQLDRQALLAPAHNSASQFAGITSCSSGCVLTMLDPVDLTGETSKSLSFYATVYTRSNNSITVELYNGTGWEEIDRIDFDAYDYSVLSWKYYKYSLDAYSHVNDFKVRFIATSTYATIYSGIDDVRIMEDRASFVPIADSFETLDAWWPDSYLYYGTYSNLTSSLNGTYGNPQPSLSLSGYSDGAVLYMTRSIDLRGLNGSSVGFNADAINFSNETGLVFPNALFINAIISDSDDTIYTTSFSPFPTNWRTLTPHDFRLDAAIWDDYAEVTLGIHDRTQDPYHRSVHFDNLHVGASSSGASGGAGGASGSADERTAASYLDPIYLAMIGDGMEETCKDMFGPGMRVLFVPQNVAVTCPLDLYE